MGTETLAAGGKRLRPALTFWATPLEHRAGERAVLAGAAVELVHMATPSSTTTCSTAHLVRRGRPTVRATHGTGVAKPSATTCSRVRRAGPYG
ncbi:MAG: hypothetical protein U0R69_05915 [Gaiellales bacterium]